MKSSQKPRITSASYDDATENLQLVYSTPDEKYGLELNSNGLVRILRNIDGESRAVVLDEKRSGEIISSFKRLDDLDIFFNSAGESGPLTVTLLSRETCGAYTFAVKAKWEQ